MSHNQKVGASGEEAAALWYTDRGFTVLARNWRPGPGAINYRGELDLILSKRRSVVFCEVKTRTSNRFGTGASSVSYAKQQTIRRLGTQWLQTSGRRFADLRFDVAVVDGSGNVTLYQACF